MKHFFLATMLISFNAIANNQSFRCSFIAGQQNVPIVTAIVNATPSPITGMVKVPFVSGYPHLKNMTAEFDITELISGAMVATLNVVPTKMQDGDRYYSNRAYAFYEADAEKIKLGLVSLTSLEVILSVSCEKL